MKKRAVIYARYSTDLQKPTSIDDQVRDCRAFIEKEGWEVVRILSDRAVSGASSARPDFQRLREGIRNREFDVVVAEALDRLSRDQEDTAGLYKRCDFAAIPIITLAEARIEEWHVGLKGTMSALFLKDLAIKTRRGLRGCVDDGRSAGGLSYGYEVVLSEEKRGHRNIKATEAAVVIRICEDYRDGLSPKRIAHNLNKERIPGPRGGTWSQSTINGNRARGTGILNNELYIGFLIWDRLTYKKDPETGKRRSFLNPLDKVRCVEVAHLRILEQDLWDAVRARQAKLDSRTTAIEKSSAFWLQQRPKFLFSKLIACGVCAGGMSMISKTHLGCSNARNKGNTVCTNRRTIKRAVLEAEVLDAMTTRLMDPHVYASFVRGFTKEWNREQHDREAEQANKRDELRQVDKKIGNIVGAIAENGTSEALQSALRQKEARKREILAEIAGADVPAPRLLPNLADLYRDKVADLQTALAEDDAQGAREIVRELVDEIRVMPAEDADLPPRIEVTGHFAAMLALGSGMKKEASLALTSQLKLVAGTGFEPVTFRL